jgi:hypothetical protein
VITSAIGRRPLGGALVAYPNRMNIGGEPSSCSVMASAALSTE